MIYCSVCGMLIYVTTSGFSQYVLASLHKPGCDTYQHSTHTAVKHDNTRSTQSAMSMSSTYNPNFVIEAKIKELMFYYVTLGCLQQQQHNLWLYKFSTIQWRIQDFPFGGGVPSHWGGGALFGKNVCENERIRSC